ncbi:MAG: DUF3649 domain-containing protein [Cycloclasticus sp.]
MALFSRLLAAIFGGYLLANVASIALTHLLPGSRADGVMVAIFVSFFIYAGAVVWVFAASTAWRAWLGLFIPGLSCASIVFLLYPQASL